MSNFYKTVRGAWSSANIDEAENEEFGTPEPSPPPSVSSPPTRSRSPSPKAPCAPKSESPALAASIDTWVRPLIEIVDKLRSLGIEKHDIALPRIVITGDQSSGKSTVVEALSGIALPRGMGMVTRAPLELRMIKMDCEWSAKLSYRLNEEDITFNILDPKDVGQKILDAQNELTSEESCVSEKELKLEVRAPNVPDLTVVDLPGIVRTVAEGQELDIEEKIKNLIRKYIEAPNTIDLVVCPANVDPAVNEAIKLAKDVDPTFERTLAVVTKPDLVDKGAENSVVDLVNNKSPVKLAGSSSWTMIKGRSQADLDKGISLAQATAQEASFFTKHKQYSRIEETKLGVNNLATKLTWILVNKIKDELPICRQQIMDRLNSLTTQLEKFGEYPCNLEDVNAMMFYFTKTTRTFANHLISRCLGESQRRPEGCELLRQARRLEETFAQGIDDARPEEEELMIEILENMKKFRGSELLPYISFDVFIFSAKKLVAQFKEPIDKCLGKVRDLILKDLANLAQEELSSFPALREKVQEIITFCCDEAYKECKTDLDKYMKKEMIPYANDNLFVREMETCAEDDKNVEDEAVSDSRLDGFSVGQCRGKPKSRFHRRFIRRTFKVLPSGKTRIIWESKEWSLKNKNVSSIQHGTIPIAVLPAPVSPSQRSIRTKFKVLSPDLNQWRIHEAGQHYKNIMTYYKMAKRRLMEYVPMEINYTMLICLSENIDQKVMAMAISADPAERRSLMCAPKLDAYRTKLMKMIANLKNCLQELNRLLNDKMLTNLSFEELRIED